MIIELKVKDIDEVNRILVELESLTESNISTSLEPLMKVLKEVKNKEELVLPDIVKEIFKKYNEKVSIYKNYLIMETSSTTYIKVSMYNKDEIQISHINGDMNFCIWNTESIEEFYKYDECPLILNIEEGIYSNIPIDSHQLEVDLITAYNYAKTTDY